MKRFGRFLGLAALLLVIAGTWLWWNHPQKVNMAGYVPADSLIYIEASNVPDIGEALTSTDGWKMLAPPAGVRSSFGGIGWLGRLIAWTGVGPADAVVLSRAQLAVTVLGIDTADAGDTLKIKPRAALVVESHSGPGRTLAAVEKRVGDFARRAYGEPSVKREQIEGVAFTTWSAANTDRRIIAAVTESLAVIGNDEPTVRSCLAVHRGERPSLAANSQLEEMRRRVDGGASLAFGYISPAGATRLLEVAAPFYANQISSNQQAQSVAASLLPQLAKKILGGAGWSARFADGLVEDRYFFALQNGTATRLREALVSSNCQKSSAGDLLPVGAYSISYYNFRDPEAAWRGLSAAVSSQLPAPFAFLITNILKASLKPYGIDEPESFLRAIGPEVITARLDESAERTLIIVEARDETALREFVAKRLGTDRPLTERIGDAILLRAKDARRGAASFIAGKLMLGEIEDVRHCLGARAQNRTLASDEAFRRAARAADAPAGQTCAVTYTNNSGPARVFIETIADGPEARRQAPNNAEFENALGHLAYALSETRVVEGGVERITRSSFGQFGTLVAQFSPGERDEGRK